MAPQLPNEPVIARGDAAQLHQVLVNLLFNARNAREHRPGNHLVTGVSRSGDNDAVVTVTDDGGGIPPEFSEGAFARFARADAAQGDAPQP